MLATISTRNGLAFLALTLSLTSLLHPAPLAAQTVEATSFSRFAVGTFSADVTIPLNHRCMGVLPTKSQRILDPLQAHGFVLLGGERPVVLCAIDWCEIRNGAYDHLRDALASAVGTRRDHVILSALHQHDAPVIDSDAAALLREVELTDELYHEAFFDEVTRRLAQAAADSLQSLQCVTHVGIGKAKVEQVASNRRVVLANGAVTYDRGSRSGDDPVLAQADEGQIDPWLKTISLWNADRPLVAIHAYATHPMSSYGAGEVSSDFVGAARERRRRDDFSIQQIYVCGASGDITAGKFNNGSPESREALTTRLHDAMVRAWQSTERIPLDEIQVAVAPLELPWHPKPELTFESLQTQLRDTSLSVEMRIRAAMGLASWQRVQRGQPIDVVAVHLGSASLLLLPGEVFVSYQLRASALAPDRMIATIGYGESWTGYVPTEAALSEGFADFWNWVGPGSEAKTIEAIREVLDAAPARPR